MQRAFDEASLVLVVAGVFVVMMSLSLGARWRMGAGITMELWTAAGLLRLAGDPSWSRIATAAAIVAVRRVVLARRTLLAGFE